MAHLHRPAHAAGFVGQEPDSLSSFSYPPGTVYRTERSDATPGRLLMSASAAENQSELRYRS